MSVDFPRAWQIADTVLPEYHHNECSYNISNGGLLCDCNVLWKHPECLDENMFFGKDGAIIADAMGGETK